jgi:hypothetical protein
MNHPFTCIVAGPTKAGKTVFVKRLIENKSFMITEPISRVLWFYGEQQPLYKDFQTEIEFIEGIPDSKTLEEGKNGAQLVVLDDLMQELKNNVLLTKLFTRGCHHWNISVIFIVQNAFFDGLRTSRINSDYMILFKNPADQLSACIIARQLFPKNSAYFLESYADATSMPHGYLFVDLTQYTADHFRLKTNIFSDTPTLYLPKNYKY